MFTTFRSQFEVAAADVLDQQLLNMALVTEDDRLDASNTWAHRGGVGAEQRAALQVLSEVKPRLVFRL